MSSLFHDKAVPVGDLSKPVVYGVYHNGELVYIGKGASLGRAAASQKEREGDSVAVVWCDSKDHASELERKMIELHLPKLNRVIPAFGDLPGKNLYVHHTKDPERIAADDREFEDKEQIRFERIERFKLALLRHMSGHRKTNPKPQEFGLDADEADEAYKETEEMRSAYLMAACNRVFAGSNREGNRI